MLVYTMMIDSPHEQSKFEKIYIEYKDLMYFVANKILNNNADAEDAVHQAFIKIVENINRIDEPISKKTKNYICIITETTALDMYRSNKRRNSVEYIADVETLSFEHIGGNELANCILKLPSNYRNVILLKYHHGFSYKEIAKLLSISEANAIKLDQRAKNKLFKICKEEGIM